MDCRLSETMFLFTTADTKNQPRKGDSTGKRTALLTRYNTERNFYQVLRSTSLFRRNSGIGGVDSVLGIPSYGVTMGRCLARAEYSRTPPKRLHIVVFFGRKYSNIMLYI